MSAEGLVRKYDVKRVDDPAGKHDDCRYFVLDPRHDAVARSALWHYATGVRLDGNEDLYRDLTDWLTDLEGGAS